MSTPNASDIRAWAQQQGLSVSERGRLAQDVVTAYEKAHPKAASAKAAESAPVAIGPAAESRQRPVAKAGTAPADHSQKAAPAPDRAPVDSALEQRVAELEKQVHSLTDRLEAVTALTRRSRAFSLPKRK